MQATTNEVHYLSLTHKGTGMIGYVTIGTADMEKSKAYSKRECLDRKTEPLIHTDTHGLAMC